MANQRFQMAALGGFGTMPKGGGVAAMRHDLYREAGVDTAEADAGLFNIVSHIKKTWPPTGLGRVALDVGYFANVIDLGTGGLGLALCTDGVGSKTIIADMMRKYDTIGIDCVAMNVNDLICVGATPLSLVDYIAIANADSAVLGGIAKGLTDGAMQAQISITGGETAQLRDIVKGFDLAGTAVGTVPMDRIISGTDIHEGDIVIGVRSSGVHSNGLTHARRAFFEKHNYSIDDYINEFGCTLGEELIRPTDIYVQETLEILKSVNGLRAIVNITSDGLLNLARVDSDTGFVIDNMIEPHPVFRLIQRLGAIEEPEMFQVFNMGVGFCYVVDPGDVEKTIQILRKHQRYAQPIGHTIADTDKMVRLVKRGIVGKGKWFSWEREAAQRRLA